MEESESPTQPGGSTPTLPLQFNNADDPSTQRFHPKELRIEPIRREEARTIWLTKHYMHRDVQSMSLELGVFSPARELVGAIGFSAYLPWSPARGRKDTWELRRFWLDERCLKNSESRVIRVAFTIIKRLCPHIRKIVSYSDISAGHKGTIYKAAGFIFDGVTVINNGNAYGDTIDVARTHKKRWIAILYP